MAIAKKGSRKLVVDDTEYRWKLGRGYWDSVKREWTPTVVINNERTDAMTVLYLEKYPEALTPKDVVEMITERGL